MTKEQSQNGGRVVKSMKKYTRKEAALNDLIESILVLKKHYSINAGSGQEKSE